MINVDAARRVATQMLNLYGTDEMTRILEHSLGEFQVDSMWSDFADQHTQFRDKILELRGALKIGDETMGRYLPTENAESMFRLALFNNVSDGGAQYLLHDLFWARNTSSHGKLKELCLIHDEGRNAARAEMLDELGLSTDLNSEISATFVDIMAKVLIGRLKLKESEPGRVIVKIGDTP